MLVPEVWVSIFLAQLWSNISPKLDQRFFGRKVGPKIFLVQFWYKFGPMGPKTFFGAKAWPKFGQLWAALGEVNPKSDFR